MVTPNRDRLTLLSDEQSIKDQPSEDTLQTITPTEMPEGIDFAGKYGEPQLPYRSKLVELEKIVDPAKPVTPLKVFGAIEDPILEAAIPALLEQGSNQFERISMLGVDPANVFNGLAAILQGSGIGLTNEESKSAVTNFLRKKLPGLEPEEGWEGLTVWELRKLLRQNFEERSLTDQLTITGVGLIPQLAAGPLGAANKVKKGFVTAKSILKDPTTVSDAGRTFANNARKIFQRSKYTSAKKVDFKVSDFTEDVRKFYNTEPLPDTFNKIQDHVFLNQTGVKSFRIEGKSIFSEMRKWKNLQQSRFSSKGNMAGATWRNKFQRPNRDGGSVFQVDKNGLVDGFNITIQDIAQDLPKYWKDLDADQKALMLEAKNYFSQFREMLDAYHINISDSVLAPDQVIDGQTIGGFYMPRGKVLSKAEQNKIKKSGEIPSRGASGYKKDRKYETMAEGIQDGAEYVSIDEAIAKYITDVGTDIGDKHTGDFLKSLAIRNDKGDIEYLVTTPQQEVLQKYPNLVNKLDKAKKEIGNIKSLLATLDKRTTNVTSTRAKSLAK